MSIKVKQRDNVDTSNKFNEEVFIRALTERPADAKTFAQSFEPIWLRAVEFQPVLAKIFEFANIHGCAPSMSTLREMLKDADPKGYESRHKATMDALDNVPYDPSKAIYTVTKAKSVAIALSLESMFHSSEIQTLIDNNEGTELMHKIQTWITRFGGSTEDIEMRVEDAFEDLIKSRNWQSNKNQIPCGIEVIDSWTGGGLQTKNLGVVLAPSGHGKSTCLMIMAYRMAMVENRRVMFISNELSMREVAARFGTLVSGKHLNQVTYNPEIIRDTLLKLKSYEMSNKLYLIEVNREISTNDIESMVSRYIQLYGWYPEAIIIDYMERMKPTVKLNRDSTWTWYGAIAQDLIRLSKRLDILIWTAGQTNRQGYNNKIQQNIDQAQGSIRHIQEAAAVIGMRQRPEFPLDNDDERVLEFTPMKMRHSKLPPDPILVEANLGKMLITKKYHSAKDWTNNEDGTGLKLTVKVNDGEDVI